MSDPIRRLLDHEVRRQVIEEAIDDVGCLDPRAAAVANEEPGDDRASLAKGYALALRHVREVLAALLVADDVEDGEEGT